MFDVIIQFAIGFIIALSGALIPGPLLVFVVNHTLRVRRRTVGLLAALGHCSVEAFIILAIVLGLRFVFRSPLFLKVVQFVGGMVMIIFGILNFRESRTSKFEAATGGAAYRPFLGGTIFTAFNATVPLWWATIGLVMLEAAMESTTFVGVLFWVLGHWSADVTWFGLAGYSVFRGRDFIGRRVHKFLIFICGLVLTFLGGVFVYVSVST